MSGSIIFLNSPKFIVTLIPIMKNRLTKEASQFISVWSAHGTGNQMPQQRLRTAANAVPSQTTRQEAVRTRYDKQQLQILETGNQGKVTKWEQTYGVGPGESSFCALSDLIRSCLPEAGGVAPQLGELLLWQRMSSVPSTHIRWVQSLTTPAPGLQRPLRASTSTPMDAHALLNLF